MTDDADLLNRCADIRNVLFRFVPGPGSQGSIDRIAFDGIPGYPDAAELITVCLDVWTVVTADQLKGPADLITSGKSKYGMFPIMRSIVEHSAWICWILDETCSPLQRIARANLDSLNTADKLNMATSILYGKGHPVAVSAKTRYRQIRNETRSTFNSVTFDPLSIEGEVFPAPTEIVKHLGVLPGSPWVVTTH